MAHYPFSDRRELLVLTCTHFLDGDSDITTVCHHFDDNTWEFVCGCQHSGSEAVAITVGELCDLDPSLHLLCDLPVGACAVRKTRAHTWEFGRIGGEDFYPAAESRLG